MVAIVLQHSSAVRQLVEGAKATAGIGKGTTTTIPIGVIFPTADPTIRLLAAMEAVEMA